MSRGGIGPVEMLLGGKDLSESEAYELAIAMLSGSLEEALVAAALAALRIKGERPGEVVGFTKALRGTCVRVGYPDSPLLDTAGTGGDGMNTINASTAAALVAAAAGATVAKHGNKSVSSSSGSADVMETLGYRLDHGPREALCMLRRTRFTFLYAPVYHPAIRAVMPVRRKLGVRTIFNIVGPLANPAGAKRQVLGVSSSRLLELMAEASTGLGYERLLLVHGAPGMDEVSVSGDTLFIEVSGRRVEEYRLSVADLGVREHSVSELRVSSPQESAGRILAVLSGSGRPADVDFIAANAGAAIYAYGLAGDLRDGVEKALQLLREGRTAEFLREVLEANSICYAAGNDKG